MMSWETGTAASHSDLLDKLNTFLLKGHALPPVYTGTGNGTITGIIGSGTSSQETITATFTSPTAFGVVGSVTGSMGSGSVGALFTHAKASFTVLAGGTAWAAGDTISFVMTPPWIAKRTSAGSEYIWQAPGNSNQDQIIVGAKTFSDVGAGYYNWRLLGATGFDSGLAFTAQPGSCTRPVLPLWSGSIPYWFFADGRRVIIVAKITTVYEHAYLGFLDAYATPGEWAYPLVVGGSMSWMAEPGATSANWKYSYVGNEHHAYWSPTPSSWYINYNDYNLCQIRLRKPDGSWVGFTTSAGYATEPVVVPFGDGFTNLKPCLDDTVVTFPVFMCDAVPNCYGEFAGLRAVSGVGRGSEDTVTLGRDTYLLLQDTSYTTTKSYAAILMA